MKLSQLPEQYDLSSLGSIQAEIQKLQSDSQVLRREAETDLSEQARRAEKKKRGREMEREREERNERQMRDRRRDRDGVM